MPQATSTAMRPLVAVAPPAATPEPKATSATPPAMTVVGDPESFGAMIDPSGGGEAERQQHEAGGRRPEAEDVSGGAGSRARRRRSWSR